MAVWEWVNDGTAALPFELRLWLAVLTFVGVRHGLRRALAHLTVHRGMNHSIPTAAIWGGVTYLCYPSDSIPLRIVMAAAVVLGVTSHLLLDELCSVDLAGHRVNKAFGTAMKFTSRSAVATVAAYLILAGVYWRISADWPADPWEGGLPTPEVRWRDGADGRDGWPIRVERGSGRVDAH